MYSMKKLIAAAAAAAMVCTSPLTALADGPGDSVSSNSGTAIVSTGSTPDGSSADNSASSNSGSTTTTTNTTSTASASSDSSKLSSLTVDTIRPLMTISRDGDMQADPVLNLVPLATYYAFTSAGDRIDYAYTSEPDSFLYAESGFKTLKIEHQNVGRWYYRTYTQGSGWGSWATSGETTQDKGNVQAVMLRVKGYSHKFGELYYRAVLNDGTVTDWAKAGQACGSIGSDKYIVGLKIAFWRNGVAFPYATDHPLDNGATEGVYNDGSGVKYATADGSAYTGWGFDADSNQYYFENGVAVTGWKAINGYNIYFDGNGVAQKDLEPVMGLQSSYAIKINKATRTVYVMTKDSSGNYTIPFKTFMCSVGPDTPLGSFKIYEQYRWHFMHTDCYCQFLSRFYQGFLLHSLLYTKADAHTFDAINYNFMDQAISGGCIRLKAGDAAWIYNNCKNGTTVTIYSDTWDKGPIEKDAINQAIPRSQDYDPTDPVVGGQQSSEDAAAVQAAQSEAAQDAAEGAIEPNV